MIDQEFRTLAAELRDHLSASVTAFMESKGYAYSIEAFCRQSAYNCDDLVMDMLLFGADIFPRSAKEIPTINQAALPKAA